MPLNYVVRSLPTLNLLLLFSIYWSSGLISTSSNWAWWGSLEDLLPFQFRWLITEARDMWNYFGLVWHMFNTGAAASTFNAPVNVKPHYQLLLDDIERTRASLSRAPGVMLLTLHIVWYMYLTIHALYTTPGVLLLELHTYTKGT